MGSYCCFLSIPLMHAGIEKSRAQEEAQRRIEEAILALAEVHPRLEESRRAFLAREWNRMTTLEIERLCTRVRIAIRLHAPKAEAISETLGECHMAWTEGLETFVRTGDSQEVMERATRFVAQARVLERALCDELKEVTKFYEK